MQRFHSDLTGLYPLILPALLLEIKPMWCWRGGLRSVPGSRRGSSFSTLDADFHEHYLIYIRPRHHLTDHDNRIPSPTTIPINTIHLYILAEAGQYDALIPQRIRGIGSASPACSSFPVSPARQNGEAAWVPIVRIQLKVPLDWNLGFFLESFILDLKRWIISQDPRFLSPIIEPPAGECEHVDGP